MKATERGEYETEEFVILDKIDSAKEAKNRLIKTIEKTKIEAARIQGEKDHLLNLFVELTRDIKGKYPSDDSSDLEEYTGNGARNLKKKEFDSNNGILSASLEGSENKRDINFHSREKMEGDGIHAGSIKKRRRVQSKETRQQPKSVETLPVDKNGKVVLPAIIQQGADLVTIHELGKVIYDEEGFHTARYIFPVGFKSSREYPSIANPTSKTIYTSSILYDAAGPIFEVVADDNESIKYSAGSASAVWKIVLEKVQELGISVKIHTSGPYMYGLSNLSVTKAIQELPGANKCTKYIMMNWIDDDKTINGRKSSAGESDIEVEAEAEAEAEEQDASNE